MAFSRSETEDRRQWPLPFPTHIPPHCISPCPRPVPYVIHTNLNPTNTTLMSSGEERHQVGAQEERKRHQEVVASLSPILLHPRYKLAQHYLRCSQELHCGLKPWQRGSQWKHSQIVWMNIKCSFFFFFVGWFCFVLLCLCRDFRQCYTLYLLRSLEELTSQQLIEAKRNIILVKQRVSSLILLGERFKLFLLTLMGLKLFLI